MFGGLAERRRRHSAGFENSPIISFHRNPGAGTKPRDLSITSAITGVRSHSITSVGSLSSPVSSILQGGLSPVRHTRDPFLLAIRQAHTSADDIVSQLQKAAKSSDPAKSLFEVVEKNGEQFDEQALDTALQLVAKTCEDIPAGQREQVIGNPTFQTLLDMTLMGAATYQPSTLCNLVNSLGRLKLDDDTVLDNLARYLMTFVPSMTADEILRLAEGLGIVGYSPGVLLLDSIKDRADQLGNDFGEQRREKLRKAMAKLGYKKTDEKIKQTPTQEEQNDRRADYA